MSTASTKNRRFSLTLALNIIRSYSEEGFYTQRGEHYPRSTHLILSRRSWGGRFRDDCNYSYPGFHDRFRFDRVRETRRSRKYQELYRWLADHELFYAHRDRLWFR